MAFVAIQRDQSAAVYAADLVQIVRNLNTGYAAIKAAADRMAEMTTEQIETLYGLAGFGTMVKAQLDAALAVLETDDGPMERLRTQIG
jgi:hypothetical protein